MTEEHDIETAELFFAGGCPSSVAPKGGVIRSTVLERGYAEVCGLSALGGAWLGTIHG